MTPEEPFQEVKASVDLTKSEIIVAVGRGIKSQENHRRRAATRRRARRGFSGFAPDLRRRMAAD
jgi:electron transfer flavoprotein alpha subunit